MTDKKDVYEKLRERLKEQKWPGIYMFKFIVPADKVDEVKELFGPAKVSTRKSRKGNYISVTGREMMLNPDRVIERYKQAAEIEGIISL